MGIFGQIWQFFRKRLEYGRLMDTARIHSTRDQYDEAIRLYEEAKKLHPTNPEADEGIKRCVESRGFRRYDEACQALAKLEYDRAVEIADLSVKESPRNPSLASLRGRAYGERAQDKLRREDREGVQADLEFAGDMHKALVVFDIRARAEKLHGESRHEEELRIRRVLTHMEPEDATQWGAIGTCLYSQEQYARSLEAFQRAQEVAKDKRSYWGWIVRCQEELGRGPDAALSMSEHIRRDAGKAPEPGTYDLRNDARAFRARLRARGGDVEGAAEDLAYVVEHDPHPTLLSHIRIELEGKPHLFIRLLESALKRMPGNSKLLEALTGALVEQTRYDLAEPAALELVKGNPGDALACGSLYIIYDRTNQLSKKEAVLDTLIALEPLDEARKMARAELRANRGDFEGALDDCRGRLDVMCHLVLDEEGRRLQMLGWILSRDPRCAEAVVRRGELRDQAAQARADYDRALEINPRLGIALLLRGSLRTEQDDPAGAIEDLTNLLLIDSEHFEAYLERGCAHAAMKNHPAAAADLERALALAPPDWHRYSEAQARLAEARRSPGS
jgi:tetratricopeptide (TPR) repeat protein